MMSELTPADRIMTLNQNSTLLDLFAFIKLSTDDKFDDYFKSTFLQKYHRYLHGRKTPFNPAHTRAKLNNPEYFTDLITISGYTRGEAHFHFVKISSWCNLRYSTNHLNRLITKHYNAQAQENALYRLVDDLEEQSFMSPIKHQLDEEQVELIISRLKHFVPSTIQQKQMMNTLKDSAADITGSVDNLSETFEKLLTSPALNKASKLPESITDASKVLATLGDAIIIAGFGYVSYKAVTKPSKKHNIAVIIYLLAIVSFKGMDECIRIFCSIKDKVMSLFTKILTTDKKDPTDDLEEQGFEDLTSFFSFFSTWPTKTISKLSSIAKLAKDLPEFLSAAWDYIKTLINKFTNNYFGLETKDDIINKADALNGIYEEVCATYNAGKLIYNSVNYDRVCKLLNQYENTFLKHADAKINQNRSRLISIKLGVLRAIQKQFQKVGFTDSYGRQEPVHICFQGPPGTKKSAIAELMAIAALNISLTPEQIKSIGLKNLLYHRNSIDPFWSKFTEYAEVCMVDDLGKRRDTVTAPCPDFEELIQMYNTVKFPLNMADVDSKGLLEFLCKWIFSTTNLDMRTFRANSMACPDAVRRRFDAIVSLEIKKEFVEKYSKQNSVIDIDIQDYNYKCYYPNTDTTETLDFSQFLQMMDTKYKLKTQYRLKNMQQYEKNQAKVHNILKKMNAKYDNPTISVDKYVNESDDESDEEDIVQEQTELPSTIRDMVKLDRKRKKDLEIIPDWGSDSDDFDLFEALPEDMLYEDPRSRINCSLPPCTETAANAAFFNLIQNFYQLPDMKQRFAVATQLDQMCPLFIIDPQVRGIVEPLQNKLDEDTLEVYLIMYNAFLSMYGNIKPENIPFMYYNLREFVVFVLLCEQNIRYGEYLFRGYHHEMDLSINSKFSVEFTVPVMDNISDRINSEKNKLFKWIGKQPVIAQIGCVLFVAGIQYYAAYKGTQILIGLIKSGYNLIIDYIWPEAEEEQSVAPKHQHSTPTKQFSLANWRSNITEQGADLSAGKQYESLLKSNIVSLTYHVGDDSIFVGYVLCLDTQHLILPSHYHRLITEKHPTELNDIVFEISKNDQIIKTLNFSEWVNCMIDVDIPDCHLMMMRIEQNTRTFKDIKSQFIRDQDLHIVSNRDTIASLMLPSDGDKICSSTIKLISLQATATKKLQKGFEYSIDTGKGDCGIPLFLKNTRLQNRRLAGIHVFGNSKGSYINRGFSTLVTQEVITLGITQLDALFKEIAENLEEQAVFMHSPYQISALRPSIIALKTNFPKSSKVPSLLLPNRETGLDPYAIALSHYTPKPTSYCNKTLQKAKLDLISELNSFPWNATYEVLSVETALYGDPDNDVFKAIPSSTSAGIPYKFTERNIKQSLLGEGVPRDETNPRFVEFKKHILQRLEDANKGIRHEYQHTDNIKDALTTPEKRAKGESRLFSGAPLDLVELQKMLFGPFAEFYMTACLDKGNAITINPASSDWTILARKLSGFSISVSTAMVLPIDYAKFDASQGVFILMAAFEVIEAWFEHHGLTKWATARITIYQEVVNSLHTANGKLYYWVSSLPSGCWLTIFINCLVNHLNVRYVYYSLVPNAFKFSNDAYLVVLGDDLALAVSKLTQKYWTPKAITEKMKELGFTVTSDDKTKPEIEFVPLKNVTFLKRSFYEVGSEVLAPLSLKTIMDTPCWSKRGDYYYKTTYDCIKFFFRELSLHTPEIWNVYAPLMRSAVQQAQLTDIEGLYHDQYTWRSQVLNSDTFTVDL